MALGFWMAGIGAALAVIAATPLPAAEIPKRGGVLTFLIPADAPPSFDGHRENSFATVHSVAPLYSNLIRANPEDPSSTTDFICDLCPAMPQPPAGGKAYTFGIPRAVRVHAGPPT